MTREPLALDRGGRSIAAAPSRPASPFSEWLGSTAAALHEVYAAAGADAPAAAGFALAAARKPGRRVVWVRHAVLDGEIGQLHACGIAELGLDPSDLVLVQARDPQGALQAGLEAARCAGCAVLVEIYGETRLYDLTASRRLALAAQTSRASVFVLRTGARPVPSAAAARWRLRALASRPLAANAPGHPSFELLLLRRRNGQEGARCIVEWDRDAGRFVESATFGAAAAPLPRAAFALSADGPGAPARRAG